MNRKIELYFYSLYRKYYKIIVMEGSDQTAGR